MKTTLIAAALVATALLATSASGIAAGGGNDETSLAQAGAPVPAAAPPTAPAPMRPGLHRPEMWQRMMHQSARERCADRLAHRAGYRAYVGARLNLTAAQRPLWDKLQAIAQNEEQQERQVCDQMKADSAETIIDRMDARQKLLANQAAGLEAAREPLAALYQALTSAQRAILDHPRPLFHRG